jgi:hypothetical protein
MKKYTKAESIEVLDSGPGSVIDYTLQKTAKTSVSELNEEEMNDLREQLTEQKDNQTS